jgi:endoglucanase
MKKSIWLAFYFAVLISCKKNDSNSTVIDNSPDPAFPATDTVLSSTMNFKGVNWADARDNFVDDWLILSGLNAIDNQETLSFKTETILNAFLAAGVNTVRLPINPPTVLQSFWPKYSYIITKAASKGMKVILAYWEAASSKDGKVDDSSSFWSMWDRVTTQYLNNGNVYFEIMNEPYGYSLNELKTLYLNWLTKYKNLSHHRILLDGAGYATDVNSIGDDSRFNNYRLSFHYYAWFSSAYQTSADWELPVKSLKYPERTVTTEFGAPMANQKNYLASPGNDNEITYIQGMSMGLHDSKVGSIYWPGLRTGDSYSMFTLSRENVTVNNQSGLTRLLFAWWSAEVDPLYAVLPVNANFKIINRNSNKSLDVNGSAVNDGANIIQWDYWGGNNQQWGLTYLGNNGYYKIVNKNSNKVVDINGRATTGGAKIIQWSDNGETSQQWQITDIGFGYYKIINRYSGQSLDISGATTDNGANVIQWYWNIGHNQQWEIDTP